MAASAAWSGGPLDWLSDFPVSLICRAVLAMPNVPITSAMIAAILPTVINVPYPVVIQSSLKCSEVRQ